MPHLHAERVTKPVKKTINTARIVLKMESRRLKRKKVNLNALIEDDTRKRQKVCADGKIKVFFNGNAIVNGICRHIRRPDTFYVMGACAWFTNKTIIDAMAHNLRGVCIVTTRDKILTAKSIKKRYATLPVYRNETSSDVDTAIRYIGSGRGYNKSLMHHKFLVGMSETGDPLWVSTGSFNLTNMATNHLENCNIISDPEVAKIYLDEFVNVYKISSPLKL